MHLHIAVEHIPVFFKQINNIKLVFLHKLNNIKLVFLHKLNNIELVLATLTKNSRERG